MNEIERARKVTLFEKIHGKISRQDLEEPLFALWVAYYPVGSKVINNRKHEVTGRVVGQELWLHCSLKEPGTYYRIELYNQTTGHSHVHEFHPPMPLEKKSRLEILWNPVNEEPVGVKIV